MTSGYIPDVLMLTNTYAGLYGYYYPKEILGMSNCSDGWSGSKVYWHLCKKYSDLPFFDKRIFADVDFKGLLFVEGCVGGKDPFLDWIEIRRYHEYKVIRKGGVDAGKTQDVPVAVEAAGTT